MKLKPMSAREQRLREKIAGDLFDCAEDIRRMPDTSATGLVGDRIETSARASASTYEAAGHRVLAGADRERSSKRGQR